MSITIDGQNKRIGLALSGGGFRATAFHLGVFSKLKEMGLLWKIDVLSCVSGGSVSVSVFSKNLADIIRMFWRRVSGASDQTGYKQYEVQVR